MKQTIIIYICIFSAIALGNLYLSSLRKKEKVTEIKGIENVVLKFNDVKTKLILNKSNSINDLIKLLPIEGKMRQAGGNLSLKLSKPITSNPVKVEKVYKGDIMLSEDDTLIIYLEEQNVNRMYTKLGKVLLIDKLDEIKDIDEIEVSIYKG